MPSRPLPDLPGVYYCKITGEYGGRPNGQVFTFQTDTPPAPGPADYLLATHVAASLETRWGTFASAELMSGYTALEVSVYPLHSPLLPAAVVASTATGSIAGSIEALSVARIVAHNVTRRGRGSQSRSFLSPVPSAQVEADGITINPTYVTALTTHWQSLISTVLGDLDALGSGAWSYVQLGKGTTLHPTPGTYQIQASEAQPLLSNIRRRTRRNG